MQDITPRRMALNETVFMLNASRPDSKSFSIRGAHGQVLVEEDGGLLLTIETVRQAARENAIRALSVFCEVSIMSGDIAILKLRRVPSRTHGDVIAKALRIGQKYRDRE